MWCQAKEAELLLINRILDDSDLTAEKFREWKQCNEELFLEIERLAAEKERAALGKEPQAAEPASTATADDDSITADGQGGAFGLRLSLGEELVDSELPASDVSQAELSVDPLNLSSTSVSSDNYFYI